MAKKKKRRRTSLLTKAINAFILYLAFQRPINLLLAGNMNRIQLEATAGLTEGSFNQRLAVQFYGPMVAAIVLKKAISIVRRMARV